MYNHNFIKNKINNKKKQTVKFNAKEERKKKEMGEEYKKKFGEPFAYIWGFRRDETKFPTDEDMIEYCLKKGKSMRKLYPRC